MALIPATIHAYLPQLTIPLPRASLQPRYSGATSKLIVTANYSVANFASWTVRNFSRRLLIFMGVVPILPNVNIALGAPVPQMEEPEIIRIQYQEASQWNKGSRYCFWRGTSS